MPSHIGFVSIYRQGEPFLFPWPAQKLTQLSQENLPGGLVFKYEVIATGERNELRSADTGRKQASLVEGDDLVLLAVEDDGGHVEVAE